MIVNFMVEDNWYILDNDLSNKCSIIEEYRGDWYTGEYFPGYVICEVEVNRLEEIKILDSNNCCFQASEACDFYTDGIHKYYVSIWCPIEGDVI